MSQRDIRAGDEVAWTIQVVAVVEQVGTTEVFARSADGKLHLLKKDKLSVRYNEAETNIVRSLDEQSVITG